MKGSIKKFLFEQAIKRNDASGPRKILNDLSESLRHLEGDVKNLGGKGVLK